MLVQIVWADTTAAPFEQTDGAPGRGYPGKIQPYKAPEALQANLQRYGLTAGWYVRDAVATNFTERAALDDHAKRHPRRNFRTSEFSNFRTSYPSFPY